MRRSRFAAAGIFVAIGVIAIGFTARSSAPATPQSAEAKRLAESEFTEIPDAQRVAFPAFAGSTVDGAAWTSAQLAGGVTVVNLWASWCGPCVDEWPELQAAAAAHPDIRWLGVNTMDRTADAQKFLAQFPSKYPHVVDVDAAIMTALKGVPNRILPVTLIIDVDARVAAWKSGPVTRDQLERGLAALSS